MEREALSLDVPTGIAPRTANDAWGIVMTHASGSNGEMQWFDYRPGFAAKPVRVTWQVGSMFATAPGELADALIRGGYARVMTKDEARIYNAGNDTVEAPTPITNEPKPTMSERDIPQTEQPVEEAVEQNGEEEQGVDTLGEAPENDKPQRVTRRKR